MAAITITIPDAILPRVVAAVAARHGYRDTIPDPANPAGPPIANPTTKSQFVKAMILEFLRADVAAFESEVARATAAAKVDSEITLN